MPFWIAQFRQLKENHKDNQFVFPKIPIAAMHFAEEKKKKTTTNKLEQGYRRTFMFSYLKELTMWVDWKRVDWITANVTQVKNECSDFCMRCLHFERWSSIIILKCENIKNKVTPEIYCLFLKMKFYPVS